jgi:catalase
MITETGESQVEVARIVDAINSVFGPQKHNRAIHAKGIVVDGSFTPSLGASELSHAPHLQGPASPVTARFSNFSGNPAIADTDLTAGPRGLALRFHLADGSATDIVAHSFNGFPVRTSEEFRELFVALGESGPGATHPTLAERFLTSHPAAQAFFAAPKPPPVSFTTLRYFAVNSFSFTNARGSVAVGRYRIEPSDGEQLLSAADAAKADPDYLRAELRERLRRGPARFRLIVQVAAAGDHVEDPSVVWPDSRPLVELGTIELDEVVGDSDAEEALLFSPASVPPGIAPADPMIQIRSDAYAVSYTRRHR